MKNETEVVLRLSSNTIGDNETNFSHKLLLTNRQVENLLKAFANHLSTDIKLLKTQLSKIIQSGRFLGGLLGPLLKTGLPLIKNAIKPLIISNIEMEAKSQGRGINRAGKSQGINRAGEGFIRAGYGSHSSKLDF